MNARIMLLPADDAGERLCAYMESILSGIAGAFGHGFTILRERIGEGSQRLYGAPLTQETVDACLKCDGVLLANASAEGMQELAVGMGISLQVRAYRAFSGEGDGHMFVARALDMQPVSLNNAVRGAFEMAQKYEIPLRHVVPSGKNASAWQSAVRIQQENRPDVRCTELSPDMAMSMMLEVPGQTGILLCPPYMGKVFLAAEAAVSPQKAFLYDTVRSRQRGLYAVVQQHVSVSPEGFNPIGTALAVSALLGNELHLEQEASCLYAATENVLNAGWRTGDMPGNGIRITGEAMTELILNQIELASQFVKK